MNEGLGEHVTKVADGAVAAPLAAFDLDGTITRGDCFVPFLISVAGWTRVLWTLARRAPLLVAGRRDRGRRDDVKAVLVRDLLAGRAGLDAAGQRFAEAVARERLRPDVVERMRWHSTAGHRVAVVTASLEVYAGPLGRLLGVDEVLATKLEVADDGTCTGRLLGRNCRGEEKVARLQAAHGQELALIWAYGDSPDDRPLLAAARHGVLVDRHRLAVAPT